VDAGLLDEAAFLGVQIAHAHEGDVARLDFRFVAEHFNQLRRSVADDRRERHAVDVARWRTLRRIHVAVSVKPHVSDALRLPAKKLGHAGKRSHGKRMIASQDERQKTFRKRAFGHVRQAAARLGGRQPDAQAGDDL